jgi:NAD(P)-dependent dehydrogenase (short-subunit alcohol dehydrogenase family)
MTDSIRKAVIVGAGPGLARSVAQRFGKDGWRIVLIARNAERLAAEAEALAAMGCDAVPVVCDVTDLHLLDDVIRREDRNGGIDMLNYNAAVIRLDTPLIQTPIDAIGSDIVIDLTAGIVAARAAIPGMRDRGGGSIIFSGGDLGFNPWPSMLTLGVGKAGLRNCAAALAKDPDCAKLSIAYVNIHAMIDRNVGDELAELYHRIHTQDISHREWDLHYERPYELPSGIR